MYEFDESGIRGSMSQISTRYAKANNKYMKNYDPKLKHKGKPLIDSYILYLDANNLYGYGMSCYLPLKNFKWNTDVWTNEEILALDDKGKIGYTFSVDIHYPKHLHDLHNNYPLARKIKQLKRKC